MARKSRISAWSSRAEKIVSHGRRLQVSRRVLAAGGILVLLAAFMALRPPLQAPPAESPGVEDAPEAAPALAAAAPSASRPAAPRPPLREPDDLAAYSGTPVPLSVPLDEAEARRFVEEQNAAARRQHELLLADGWAPVDMPPPDPAVLSLDPSLLDGRERELRMHLETNALSDGQLDNALAIALRAGERRTRNAAIQALGHARSPRGQELLTQLFDQLQDPGEQSLALGFLRPRSLAEPSVDWMLERLASPAIPPELKKQMTYSLVLAQLVESGADHAAQLPRLLARVPGAMRPVVLETYQAIVKETPELTP